MAIRRDARTGIAIIDETFQVRDQTLTIGIPVAEHLLANAAGRRAVADQIEHYVTGGARPHWATRHEMHYAVNANATYRDLRGLPPLDAGTDQPREIVRGQWATATPQGPVFWTNQETVQVMFHTETDVAERALADAYARTEATPKKGPKVPGCACGQRYSSTGMPNLAWEHGADECVFIERPVEQFVNHDDDPVDGPVEG